MPQPEFSIVMPMLNAEPFVREALDSVLQQRGVDLEVIVVDDGSIDGSVAAVKSMADSRVHLVTGRKLGVAEAFNTALSYATGRLLARCDADDHFVEGRLARQGEWLRNHPDFAAICGGFAAITDKGAFVSDMECGVEAEDITEELRRGHTRTSFCTWLVRTDLVRKIGGCREYFSTAEDIDLMLRLCEVGSVWYEPVRNYRYRLHDASATHSRGDAVRYFFDGTARRFRSQRSLGRLDDLQRGRPPIPPFNDETDVTCSRNHVQKLLLGAAWGEHASGRRIKALSTAWRACITRPLNFEAWRSLGALAIRGHRD